MKHKKADDYLYDFVRYTAIALIGGSVLYSLAEAVFVLIK